MLQVMVHEAWVCPWLASGAEHGGAKPWSHFNGTLGNATSGILVWGADHFLTNVIVFESAMGVEVGVEVAGGGNSERHSPLIPSPLLLRCLGRLKRRCAQS